MHIFLFTLMQIRIRMDPNYFGKLDPDLDLEEPHQKQIQ
jgi:hypothetical protein